MEFGGLGELDRSAFSPSVNFPRNPFQCRVVKQAFWHHYISQRRPEYNSSKWNAIPSGGPVCQTLIPWLHTLIDDLFYYGIELSMMGGVQVIDIRCDTPSILV
jgi:hypothetical protein